MEPKGPLDDLLGGARVPAPHLPDVPVHPRVLPFLEKAPRGEGDGVSLLLVLWRDPGGVAALHQALRPAVEAALLNELSHPAEGALELPLTSLRLLTFAEVAQAQDAVAAFGLQPAPLDGSWRELVTRARGEASVVGRPVPDDPVAAFRAEAVTTAVARELEPALRERCGDEAWGMRPGAFFARAVDLLGQAEAWGPDREALDAFAHQILPTEVGPIRWIPPLCFQALCDAVALVAAEELGKKIAWADCTPDVEGVAPPPLVAIHEGGQPRYLPVGEELLRWCVMPLRAGEEIPPLSAWVTDRFG